MSLRTSLLSFLRVPPAPSAPVGDDDVRIFRAAPNYFLYRAAKWVLTNVGGVAGLFVGVGFLRTMPERFASPGLMLLLNVIEYCAIGGFLAQALWSFALLRLDFEQRWYIVSDRSLRIREGLIRMHEKTMTFANLQNVTIVQGPLQRLLGIADLQVRTAGGGGGSSEEPGQKGGHDMHVAYFRGVENAQAIRETIRERLRRHGDAGLGDPDDARPAQKALPADTSLLTAARSLAEEAAALRRAALTTGRA